MSQTITKVKQLIDQKTVRLETLVETFVESASTLDNRLKGQVPRSLRNSGLMIRELAVATLIAFLAGGLFFRPLVNFAVSKLCTNVPKVCEVSHEKQ
ncbi:MAG: hypothetical protein F6K11_27495 [Leptolyngbya sp. SIO3F4]|nr:hypothetical protein [Leptolyngbya sp. SIO3F4]